MFVPDKKKRTFDAIVVGSGAGGGRADFEAGRSFGGNRGAR